MVLLGTSRIKADISIDALHRALPGYAIVQLAINGFQSPIAVFRDLAGDHKFRGVIVCEFDTLFIDRSRADDNRAVVAFHPSSESAYWNTIARAYLQDKLTVLGSSFTLRACCACVLLSSLPRHPVYRTHFSRAAEWDFSASANENEFGRAQTANARNFFRKHSIPARSSSLVEDVASLNESVKLLRTHNSEVVFVGLPTTSDRWKLDEEVSPKAISWDRFAALTIASTMHFKDLAALRSFRCPDGLHLDSRTNAIFTAALCRELTARFPSLFSLQ